MTKSFIVFCLALLLPFFSSSQGKDSLMLQKADSLMKIKDYENAGKLYYYQFRKHTSTKDSGHPLPPFINFIITKYRAKKYADVIDTTRIWIEKIENQKNVDKFLLGKIYLYNALTYRKMGQMANALRYYQTAINYYESVNANHSNVAYVYKNAAQILIRQLDYAKAVSYLETALVSDSTAKHNVYAYNQLAGLYEIIKDEQKSLKFYTLGRNLAKTDEEIAYNDATGGSVYFLIGDLKTSKKLYLKALNYFKNNASNWEVLGRFYTSLAEIEIRFGNQSDAEKYILKAIQLIENNSSIKNREAARIHSMAGNYFKDQNQINQALTHYQQALIQVFPNFNSTDINDNPAIEDIYTESWIMTASARKGEALRARYNLNNDINDLKNAAYCYDLSLAGIKALNDSYGTDNAKLYLGDYSYNYFEEAIEVNYLLFKNTNEKKYLEKIFSIMERSKASVLTEAIQKNEALILAGIPDSLLKKEKVLRLELAEINTNIKKEELYESKANQEYISEMRSRSVTQQREYEVLLDELKNNFPAFKSFAEEPAKPTITEMQKYLAHRGETFLEYFVGTENIYLIKINQDSAEIYQSPRTDFWDDQVNDFQDYFRNSSSIINDPDGYFTAAEILYQQIFPFDSLPEKIIIVPDNQLNFIPFDALVEEAPKNANFNEADFLIKKHLIRYAYSGGLLLRPVSEKINLNKVKSRISTGNKKLLRVEPMFVNRERGQASLVMRQENGVEIKNMETLAGAEAKLASFKNVAPQCRLIEFFTHAGADDTDFAPRIEFIDTSLYLPELYAMDIPAELVVLSACETGLGKFEKGEGVMSLARGFAYAGASDLVASLWKVNEGSTANLIDLFYQHLFAGNSKSAALRAAKLQYFADAGSDVKLSPYYWAGFISIGPDTVMDFSQSQWPWWWLVIGIGVLVFLWRWKKSPVG